MEEKGWLMHRPRGGVDGSSNQGRAARSIGQSKNRCGTNQAGRQA